MRFRYYICDVFTDTRFGGNPLAVLPDGTGLTDRQMQQIAMEAPGDRLPEDPATGSANCALVCLLSQLDAAKDGTFAIPLSPYLKLGLGVSADRAPSVIRNPPLTYSVARRKRLLRLARPLNALPARHPYAEFVMNPNVTKATPKTII